MFSEYMLSFLGLWVIIATIIAQHVIAVAAHRKSGDFVPGKINKELGHDSFVFRSDRTFKNSLENIVIFVIPVFMAMFLDVYNMTLAFLVWGFAIARIGHMVAYYKDERTTNPTPKSYFFLAGFVFNVLLMLVLLIQIFTM